VVEADWSSSDRLQYDAMATIKSAVIDSALWTGVSEPELVRIGLPLVQLFCDCPFAVVRDRYFARPRHEGFEAERMTIEDYEQYRPLRHPLAADFPLIRVDTNQAIDYAPLFNQLAEHLRVAPSRTHDSDRG
jgi:hypothetical protein